MSQIPPIPVPMDFVYAGKRSLVGGAWGHAVIPINNETLLEKERVFAGSAMRSLVVGGIYRGADFSPSQAAGLKRATWVRIWHDQTAIAGWRAQDDAVDEEIAAKRAEKKYVDPIAAAVLPLRRIAADLRKRGAHQEVWAFLNMVNKELHRPLRVDERDGE